MPTYPMYFQPLSFEQNNPVMTGMQAGQNLMGTMYENQLRNVQAQAAQAQLPYAGPQAAAALQNQQLLNQMKQLGMPYVAPQAAAQVGFTNAQANEANARGGLFGVQGNLIRQQTPALVQQENAKVYSDPTLNRLWQINQAQQSGQIPNSLLNMLGFGGQQPQSNSQQYQPTDQDVAKATQQTGIPFMMPSLARQQLGQQAQQQAASYPVLPSAGGMQPNQMPALQAGPNGTLQPTAATAPKMFGGNPTQNFALFGTPYNPIQYKALETGATSGAKGDVDAWNKAQADAEDTANNATYMLGQIDKFNSGYGKSYFKGSVKGELPNMYQTIASRIYGNGDLSEEQSADQSANNLAAAASHALFPGQRVTNNEVALAKSAKVARNMDPGSVAKTSAIMKAQAQRSSEYQQFMNAARQTGNMSAQTAQALFQTYNQQRPYFDGKNGTPFSGSLGTWRDYLTPEMINAAQNNQPSPVLAPTFQNKNERDRWFQALQPADQKQYLTQLQNQRGK